MAEVLIAWLRMRLGVLLDLTPDMFGRYARDGTMIAQLLYNYGIITEDQLSAINSTQDPALARVNLRLVRIWLKVINVSLTDDCLNDISKARGPASLHLFYKVYLALEGKDRLHFIALCKEREKFTPISNRFEVVKICEDPPPYRSHDHPLSKPLAKAINTIRWHEKKFWKLSKQYKQQRQQRLKIAEHVIEPSECFIPQQKIPEQIVKSEQLDEFARLHPPKKSRKYYHVVECCPGKKSLAVSCVKNSTLATEYVEFLKKRTDKAAKSYEMKLKTQTAMMTDAWEQLLKKQDRFLDETVCRRVLDQSRYEKQMIKKLCEVWDLRRRIVDNRKLVETMLRNTLENEYHFTEDRRQEILKGDIENVEMEACRMAQLRRRIHDEKVHRMREMYRGICVEILKDLADFAIKMSQYSQANNSHVLHSIWSECRTAFLKGQPIFEDFEEKKKKETIVDKELKVEEKPRQEDRKLLVDMDFENYRDLVAPWDEFVQERDEAIEEVSRLGRIVLGYVVHRLLEILYPLPLEVTARPIPEVKVAAIILGITNSALHEQLRQLLTVGGIHLLRMEDAINHCLENYKREMSQIKYIDLDTLAAKNANTLKENFKTEERSKKIEKTKSIGTAEEKETQTPRQIPYDDMDPVLSDSASIGKWIYEFLMLGQPISNELNTKIVIEYLKGIEFVKGWALINYPNTYEQMAMLEEALIGYKVPPEPKIDDFTDINIEAIDPPPPRIVFKETIDAYVICRQSRLLPNPITRQKDLTATTTYMTIYVKAMPRSKLLNEEQFCIPIPKDATSIDEFYVNENIAYGFFYNVLDRATLQQLADLIIGELPTTKSLEEEVPPKISHSKQKPIDSKVAIVKRLVTKSRWESSQCEEEEDIKVENHDLQPQVETQLAGDQLAVIKPGEDDWQWLNLPQSPVLLEALALLWESMEEAYVENMKEILSLKKMHISSIMPYKEFMMNNLIQYIKRPDKRQILLQDFHRAFNNIDEDLRDDVDTKCELYCRVDEFRTELWELCDIRRIESEDERKRNLRDQWILLKAAILVNVYTGMLQIEVDQFIDTMQLLQDYYTSMSQKPLKESPFSKVALQQIELEEFLQKSPSEAGIEQQTTPTKTKDKEVRTTNIDHFKGEIEDLFIDISKDFDPDQSRVFNFVKDNIQRVRNTVNFISSVVLDALYKEEKSMLSKIEKGRSMGDAVDSPLDKLDSRHRDLVEEWRYAVSFTIDCVNQRLDVLNAAARSDITFLLDTMRQMFHRIYQRIVERYKREIENINEMAKVFCLAIEEEKPIQEELLLEGDQFIVKSDVIMFPEDVEKVLIRDVPLPLQFRVVQLGRLIDIFKRIAPRGSINERALIYVLQDLVSCEEEDCYPSSVPCAWRQLRPPDIEKLIKKLFGNADMIEWREFIVYALGLRMPTHQEILKMLAAFKLKDLELKEKIHRNQFHETPLWFLEITLPMEHKDKDMKYRYEHRNYDEIMNAILFEEARLSDRPLGHLKSKKDLLEVDENVIGSDDAMLRLMLIKELLCRMYLVNRKKVHYTSMLLAFCKDEDPREGLGKAFTLAMGVRVCTDILEGEKFVEKERERIRKLKLTEDYLREEATKTVDIVMERLIDKVERKISEILQLYKIVRPPLKIVELDAENDVNMIEPLPEIARKRLEIEKLNEVEDKVELKVLEVEEAEEEEARISDVLIQKYLKETVYWLPRDICISILSICLPRYILQTDLLETCESLHEGILRVYDELRDEELTDETDVVLAYRLVNHSFILKLLAASSAFVSRNMSALLRDILDKNIK